MRLQVDHRTHYQYDQPVSFGDHAFYLRPREGQILRVESFGLESSVESVKLRWVCDCFNNVVAVANFGLTEAAELSFRCRIVCELGEGNPFDFILDPRATAFPFSYDERELSALQPYLSSGVPPGAGRVLDWFCHAVGGPNASRDTISFLLDINSAICRDIGYAARDDEGVQTPDETLELRTGSCRDMSVLFIAACRQLGLAARFVSGYLYVPPNAGREGMESDRAAGSMHAWAEIYLPGAGWKGFDPTNGVLADRLFLPAAVANRPEWVNPIQGKYFHKQRIVSHLHVDLKIEEIV